MIALIQRVTRSQVDVDGVTVGSIERGLLALIGVQRGDEEAQADRLLDKVLSYRVFADANERMNLSVKDIDGAVLWVPQFTLAADTAKGTRPGFSVAAPPDEGRRLFEYLVARALRIHPRGGSGVFGANMQVSLVNDGPVTFWLQAAPQA